MAIFVYLHSQSQRFFDASFKFSNDHCRCTAYGNFAILLFPMQRVTGYLLTPNDLDFRRFFRHKRPITPKNKDDINVTRGKTLPDIIMSSLLLSKTDIGLKHFFFAHNVKYGNSVTFRIWVS